MTLSMTAMLFYHILSSLRARDVVVECVSLFHRAHLQLQRRRRCACRGRSCSGYLQHVTRRHALTDGTRRAGERV
jgi:hypothetical protein